MPNTPLEEHLPSVYRFALRLTRNPHEAEDLTQDAFVKAWRRRRQLRKAKSARAWLFQVTVNLWRDRLRSRRRSPERAESSLDHHERAEVPPDLKLIVQEDVERTLEAVDSLPSRQREVLYLHAVEGFSIAEIADVLDTSSAAVKASLSLARKRIRRKLVDICPDRSAVP